MSNDTELEAAGAERVAEAVPVVEWVVPVAEWVVDGVSLPVRVPVGMPVGMPVGKLLIEQIPLTALRITVEVLVTH